MLGSPHESSFLLHHAYLSAFIVTMPKPRVDISGDKLVRATELMKLLSLEKSMKGAIKLVTALKLPNLAERFSSILEVSFLHSNEVLFTQRISICCHLYLLIPACLKQERLLHEMKKNTETNLQQSTLAPITADSPLSGSMAPTQTEASKVVNISSSPKLSAPLFTKKNKTQEGAQAGINKTAMVNETLMVKQTGTETSDKRGKMGDMSQVQPHPHDPSLKSNMQGVNKSEASLAQSSRPSNPFLKSSIK